MKKRVHQVLGALILALVILSGCHRPARILVVTGGHDFDTAEFYNLFASLENSTFDTVSHPRAMEILATGETDRYNVVVFYDYIPDMPLKDSLVFLRLTHKGMPMLFLHHSLCNFQNWDGYRQMVGGKYTIPEFQSDSTLHSGYRHDIDIPVKVLDPNHPVTEGVDDFVIHDEGYSNIRINKDVHPLLGTTHADCAPLLAWVNRYQNSTCLYLMLGHDSVAYANENFRILLYNSIQWLSHEKY
jgi:hypothetical protein